MRCGLFGKLSAKRDFIALATPRHFLEAWEPWVQACMSASQHRLGSDWQQAFLTAPLWRFWLGADLLGATVLGVFMPSVDGVGRYYPLTLLAMADPSFSIPPPDFNPHDQWCATAESFLLSTLDRSKSFDDISSALDGLAAPQMEATVCETKEICWLGGTTVGTVTAGKTLQGSLTELRRSNHSTLAGASFWWTEGGEGFPPMALCSHGLPDPFCYSNMLTGEFPGQAIERA